MLMTEVCSGKMQTAGEKVMLKVLYEDRHILVAVKPAGIESQQSRRFEPDMVSTIKIICSYPQNYQHLFPQQKNPMWELSTVCISRSEALWCTQKLKKLLHP